MPRLVLLVLVVVAPLRAQAADSVSAHPRPALDARDLLYAAGAGAATLAVAPFDEPLAHYFRTHGQESPALHRLARTVERITVPGAFIIGGGLYLGGRLGGNDRMADLGLHGTEAALIGLAATTVIKVGAGRARPYVSRDRPHDFAFMRGLTRDEYQSFPSGHAVIAFAVAAAVTEEARRWEPGSEWYVGPALYGGATLVGLARMYNDRHWASDVVMGAAIGIFTGRRVVAWQHTHPGNRLDRWLLGVSIAPEAGGTGRVVRLIAVPW